MTISEIIMKLKDNVGQFNDVVLHTLGTADIYRIVLENYFSLFLVLICSYLLASLLINKDIYISKLEKITVLTTIGLGILATILFIAGILRFYYPVQLIILITGILAVYKIIKNKKTINIRDLKQLLVRNKIKFIVTLIPVIILLLPIMLLSMYPETTWDSTMYHLVYSKTYLSNHIIAPVDQIRVPVFPQLIEILQGSVISFTGDETAAKALNVALLLLNTMIIYFLGVRFYSKKIGYWSALLFISVPLIEYVTGTSYIDIGLALYISIALFAFMNWHHTNEKTWIYCFSMAIGFAAGIKYTGLTFAIIIFVLYSWYCYKRKQKKYVYLLPAISFLVALPWYLYNYYYTLNPLFPFYQNIFGNYDWNESDFVNIGRSLKEDYGMGRGIKEVLLLPWNLTVHHVNFFGEAPISFYFILATPLALFRLFKDKYLRILIVFSVCYVAFWFSEGQVLRYLIPIIPVLCVITIVSFDEIIFKNIFKKGYNQFIILIVSLLLIFPGALYAMKSVGQHGIIPSNAMEKQQYLDKNVYPYPAINWLNQNKGVDYRVYTLYAENMYYFVNGSMIGEWVGKNRYEEITPLLNDGKKLSEELSSKGANYLLYTSHRVKNDFIKDQYFKQHFKLVYARPNIYLYEVNQMPLTTSMGPEIFLNSGFELYSNEKGLNDWGIEGTPYINSELESYIFSGTKSVNIDTSNTIYQIVPIGEESDTKEVFEKAQVYRLSIEVRSFDQSPTLRMQVSWLDENSKFIYSDMEDKNVGNDWEGIETYITPPRYAKYAVFYFRSLNGNIFVDNASLRSVVYNG
jgi:hypothetical protein